MADRRLQELDPRADRERKFESIAKIVLISLGLVPLAAVVLIGILWGLWWTLEAVFTAVLEMISGDFEDPDAGLMLFDWLVELLAR